MYSLRKSGSLCCVCFGVIKKCFQKVFSKITFLWFIFAAFLVVLGPFWLYEEFDDRYPKKPVSVTKKDMGDYNHHIITAYDSTVQNLAAKIHQKSPLLDQK